MSEYVFHVIPNAHLDPVWLWDWREGLNEGLITCRTILDLMDEDPELTFIRGEAAIYDHIERTDPATFARIKQYVNDGRWDIVGGTWIQPDSNLPATETLARHFMRGQQYFRSRFGRTARVAWHADCFGHSAGLPEILASAGMEAYAFWRPFESVLPLPKPVFWWEADSGRRILAYRLMVGWYGTERDEIERRFDGYLEAAAGYGLKNVACFIGLGNHGGGPTRRHLADLRAWAARHPEVKVVFSGLHRFFDAVRDEVAARGPSFLPVYRGELNFTMRGCYASVARFKYAFRRTEATVARIERTDAAIRAATGTAPADLAPAWDAVLFNTFHDILPGTSIERAFEDQLAWLGGALHACQRAELAALNALAEKVDTRVPRPADDMPAAVPLLVWNPHPAPYRGHIELEASLDYRPIAPYFGRPDELPVEVRGPEGQPLPFQSIQTESSRIPDVPWRWRVVVPVTLPGMGWSVLTMGWVEGARQKTVRSQVSARKPGTITNGLYSVRARRGARGVQILYKGKPIFAGPGLGAVTVEDPYGSWGDPNDKDINLSRVLHHWTLTHVKILETGPERASLWTQWKGGQSRLELTFHLYRGRQAVDVSARLLWNERSARLKLVMPVGGDESQFEVPGAVVRRGPVGEAPGGRWLQVKGARGTFGFASDALYAFDCTKGALRATVARAACYATNALKPIDAKAELWRPVECGELTFRMLFSPGGPDLPRLADELRDPPLSLPVPAKAGPWPRSGSLMSIEPSSLRLLAMKSASDGNGWILRVQNPGNKPVEATLTWQGKPLSLGRIDAGRIASWRLTGDGDQWRAAATNTVEL